MLCIGEMGIGNTTIAAALAHGLYGGTAEEWVGPGTGVDSEGLKRKADAVRRAVSLHKPRLGDPLEVLRRLGGRELAAMAGAILGARMQRVPVLIDGYVATAAAAVLHAANPAALDHCMAAHVSAEPAHKALLARIGKRPLLDLGMRLGEASGAAMGSRCREGGRQYPRQYGHIRQRRCERKGLARQADELALCLAGNRRRRHKLIARAGEERATPGRCR